MRNQVMPVSSTSGKPEIIQSPMYGIIADIVKNNKNLTKELQNAIARFIEIEATPRYQVNVKTAAIEGLDQFWPGKNAPDGDERSSDEL